MAEDLDDVVTREFRALDDLDVPDLWARIVALADTEPIQSARSRRRWPAVAAAAALVVAIAGGVWLTVRDDSEPSSTPVDGGGPAAAAEANTVGVVFGDDDTAFDAEAVAGWVTFDIDNPTDDFRFVDVRPLRPGSTFEEVWAELATVDDGDTSVMERVTEATLVGTLIRPHGTATVTAPITAGEFLVNSGVLDGRGGYVANSGRVHELRVGAGNAGQPPQPTAVYEMVGATPIGPASIPAGRTTIQVTDGDDGPYELILNDMRDGSGRGDFDNWDAQFQAGTADQYDAPADNSVWVWGSAPDRAVTIDLDPGELLLVAAADLDTVDYRGLQWVHVD